MIESRVVPEVTNGTLPVFMAPEFLLKWRDGLPYQRTTFFNAMGYLEALSTAFPEVLWILGTVW